MEGIKARFGIGNATVDLIVPETLTQGATETAHVEVEGGDVAQEVEGIYAKLRTRDPDQHHTHEVFSLQDETFVIEPEDSESFDVEFEVPRDTPVSTLGEGDVDVWIDTGLEIDIAVDPDDRDYVDIEPGAEFEAVHRGLVDHLGFEAVSSRIDVVSGLNDQTVEVQYRPTDDSPYDDGLDELDVVIVAYDDGLDVRLEPIGPDTGGTFHAKDYHTITVATTDPDEAVEPVRNLLEE